ncbi:hypothetical protein [Cryobacterium sp. 5B3]|nr:hypothetical protein [Cryobacterium sp. 5B3]MEB0276408.1 hypothetical protein [Cryobacterium sp. 5B3]
MPALAILALLILILSGLAVGRNQRLGVAVLGGTIAPILIPQLNIGWPTQTGMFVGLSWLSLFALLGTWKPLHGRIYSLFVVVAAIGMLGAITMTPFALNAQIVVYTMILGFFAARLDNAELRILLTGIVAVALIEAAICSFELLILGKPILGVTSGPHPLLLGLMRGQGTLRHPLVAGMVMLTGQTLLGATVHQGALRVALGSLLLFGIFATGSSSIFIATVPCLALNYLISRRASARSIKLISATAVAIYFLANSSILEPITSDVSGANAAPRLNSIIAFPRPQF